MKEKSVRIGKSVMIIIYLVGVLGLFLPAFRPHFVVLTPVTLLISAFILFYFHEDWNKSTYLFMIIAFVIGFGIEAIGVATGVVFGDYTYSNILGPKLLATPLIIGINWLILIYASGTIVSVIPGSNVLRAIVGAVLMVVLDLVIEPVAVKLNFWSWSAGEIPVLNYFMWFIVSLVLLLIFYSLSFKKSNKIAFTFFLVQISFFTILAIVL